MNKNSIKLSVKDMVQGTTPHFLVMVLAILMSSTTFAAWRIGPVLKVGAENDDNATLQTRTDQEVHLQGYLLEASANIDYSSPLTTISLVPRILSTNYADNPELESTDIFFNASLNHRMKNSSVNFRINFDDQTIRTAERADTDLDVNNPTDIPSDDSGRIGLLGDRSKWRFSPEWSFQVSKLSRFSADIDYFNVQYDDVFSGLLSGYTDARLNLNYRRELSSRNALLFTATGRQFDSENLTSNDVTGYGLMTGIFRSLSQKTTLKAMIGAERTDQSRGQTTSEVVGNITLLRRLETINMLAQYSRSINASGSGRVSTRDQLSVNFNRRLNQRISSGLGIRAYHTKGLGGTTSVDDRNYVQLRTKFAWHVSSTFLIEADYRYTILDRGNALSERANSNHVTLWFVYQPNRETR